LIMRTYKIGAMVRHSGKHLQYEALCDNLTDAFDIFGLWLKSINLHTDALCELDISEVVQ
jgi:hypothetical protein